MIQQIYSVRVFLTDDCPDTIDGIIHSDGSSLGSTFDKIQVEAIKCGGSYENWEPTMCDYAFPSIEAAKKFTSIVTNKFKTQIICEILSRVEDQDGQGMRSYKNLPDGVKERIAALTPQKMLDLNVQINILEDDDCLIEVSSKIEGHEKIAKTHRMTYANMKCKITDKVRGKPVVLRSGSKLAIPNLKNAFITIDDYKREIERANKAGWNLPDISYDSIINGLMKKEIEQCIVNGKSFPEIQFACDTVSIIVYDYKGIQFIGWFFSNSNLDELMNFTNYKI